MCRLSFGYRHDEALLIVESQVEFPMLARDQRIQILSARV